MGVHVDPEAEHSIPCMICRTPLRYIWAPADRDADELHIGSVSDGTLWRTWGNYGSSVFDPAGSERIEGAICDGCLENLLAAGIVTEFKGERPEGKMGGTRPRARIKRESQPPA